MQDLARHFHRHAATLNITVCFSYPGWHQDCGTPTGYESAVTRAYLARQTDSHLNFEKTHLPRAQRLSLQTPVRYRAQGLGIWREGIVENLSQSGVLFHGPMHLPEFALVEMVFEMPEEISGQKHRTVLCQGRVLRRNEVSHCGAVGLATSILDYTFLRQN